MKTPTLASVLPRTWLALLLICLAVSSELNAQVAGTVDATYDPNVTGNRVTSIAVQPDGKTLIGGTFTAVGGASHAHIARLNVNGSVDATFTAVLDGSVSSIVIQADGKILISGQFGQVNGTARVYLARLNANGTLDGTFTPSIDDFPYCMALQPDGKVLIGGEFGTVNASSRSKIARLKADGTLDTTFDPGTGADARVGTLLIQPDGKIIIGGLFTNVSGSSRNHIARLNANGSVESTATFNPGTGTSDNVYGLALQADGKILLGGEFATVNGLSRNTIARLNTDGSVESASTFSAGTNGSVNTIALQSNGGILIGGNFSAVNGITNVGLARLNSDGSLESTGTFDDAFGLDNACTALCLQSDGGILVGGNFSFVGTTTRNRFARLSNDTVTQILSAPNAANVKWFRGGAGPEVTAMTAELSINAGATWTALGAGTRIAGGWQVSALSLPASGMIRARGRVAGGFQSSSGLIEQVASFNLAFTPPTVSGASSASITGTSAVLGGNVSSDGGAAITGRGVIYSITAVNSNPQFGGNGVIKLSGNGTTGIFTVNASALIPNTGYSFAAYAINSSGLTISAPAATFSTPTAPPSLIAPTSASITTTTATLGANATSNNGAAITERGIVYALTATNGNPQAGGAGTTKLTASGTTGVFTVNATSLTPGADYSFVGYAINSLGTGYTSPVASFSALAALPVVNAPTVTNILPTSATAGGTVVSDGGAAVTSRGICLSVTSTNSNPTQGGNGVTSYGSGAGTGTFTTSFGGLTLGVNYSFVAYAGNSAGSAYSAVSTFTAAAALPTVSSPTSSSITTVSASLGGISNDDGGAAISEVGIVYSVTSANANPLLGGAGVTKLFQLGNSNSFGFSATGLSPATSYSFKAYATNSVGTAYTTPVSTFVTLAIVPPGLHSPSAFNITLTSAVLDGTVNDDGGAPITERGAVYSLTATNSNPKVGGAGVTKVTASGLLGFFSIPISGLTPGSNYSFAMYATNSAGSGYTTPVGTFNTTAVSVPNLSSPSSSSISSSTASTFGFIANDGGAPITERGFVYAPTATNADPLIGGAGVAKFVNTGTTSSVASQLTGLTAATNYTFKAYATNSIGNGYTAPSTFTTAAATAPTVASSTSASITATSAILGGNVTNTGGALIMERGVVFSDSSINVNPVVGGANVTKVIAPGTSGIFTISATGLSPGINYYFRAYAVNSVGTSYSSLTSFNSAADVASITAPTSASITTTSAVLGGTITSFNGGGLSEKGIVYSITSTNADPLIGGGGVSNISLGGSLGVFTTTAPGLDSGTNYSFKAYAINSIGISYTAVSTFTTNAELSFSAPVFTVNSSAAAGTADIAIRRTGKAGGAVSCLLDTSNVTASAPQQYTSQFGTVIALPNGTAVQHLLIPIAANATTTTAKTFNLALYNASGITLGAPSTAIVVILPPASATDAVKPTTTIVAPLSNAIIGDVPLISITGIAADNIGISRVQVSINKGITYADATLGALGTASTPYSISLAPQPGLNVIQVRAYDFKGNISAVTTRNITYLRTLTVAVGGPAKAGSVTAGFVPTSLRQSGKALSITAKPAAGFVFDGWTANSNNGTNITTASAELPALSFIMQPNLVLVAHFLANPFTPAIIGAFNGLATPVVPTISGNDTVGLLQNLIVTSTGSFSGTLKIDGLSLSLIGKFDNTGAARFGVTRSKTMSLTRPGKPTLDVTLQLDMLGITSKITGNIKQTYRGNVVANSLIDADRANYSLNNKVPVPLTAKPYTLIIPSKAQSPFIAALYYPQGEGYATMSVSSAGVVSLSGKLADHTAITASGPLSKTNKWPVFAQLYGLKGSLSGQASLTDAIATVEDVTATLTWFRPYQVTQWYPYGWTDGIKVDVLGARYTLPPTVPALSVFPALQAITPNATLTFANGQLSSSVIKSITISPLNIVTNSPAASSPTMFITKTSGLISGSFTHTDSSKPTYQGIILQKGAVKGAHGYFMTFSPKVLNYLGESGAVRAVAN